jgi:hypothetical protein
MHSRRAWVVATILALSVGPVAAQGPAAGGEAALRNLVGPTARALAAFDDALGLRQEAAVPAHAAGCVADGTCDLASALDALRVAADTVREQTGQLRRDDTRLGSTFTAPAVAALLPAAQALPAWDQAHNSAALQSNSALAQKWSLTQRAIVAAMQAGVGYLKFSGADTSKLDAPLAGVPPAH